MEESRISESTSSRNDLGPPLPHGLEDEVLEVITNEKGDLDAPEEAVVQTSQERVNVQALPTKGYLDETVIPILLMALRQLDSRRPPDPIAHLAAYLIANKEKYKKVEIFDDVEKEKQEELPKNAENGEKPEAVPESTTA